MDEKKICNEMIKRIKEKYKKILDEEDRKKWEIVIDHFDQIPNYEEGIDYYGQPYETGFRVYYEKDGKTINLEEIYKYCSNNLSEERTADKTFREQLEELISKREITPETWIIFDWCEWKDKEIENGWKYRFRAKKIIPYLKRKKYESLLAEEDRKKWKFITEFLDKLPFYDESISKGYEYGTKIYYLSGNKEEELEVLYNCYRDGWIIEHNEEKISYRTFREQLIVLIAEKKITPQTWIIFKWHDYNEEENHDNSWEYRFQAKDIMPYLV